MLTKFETKSNRVKGLAFHPKRCVQHASGWTGGGRVPCGSHRGRQQCRGASTQRAEGRRAAPLLLPLPLMPARPLRTQAMDPGVAAQRRHPGAP